MGGLAVLFMLCGYIFIAIFAIKGARKKVWSPLVPVFVIAFPFADALVGRAVLQARCDAPSAMVIARTVKNVDGISIEQGPFEDSPTYYGYEFVEGARRRSNNTWDGIVLVSRATAISGGKSVTEDRVPSKALYEVVEERSRSGFYFGKSQTIVRAIETKEEMARLDWWGFNGGWAEQAALIFSDSGPGEVASCGDFREKHKRMVEILHKSLQPAPRAQ